MMRATVVSFALLLVVPVAVAAQPAPERCAYFTERIDSLVNGATPKPGQDFAVDLLDISQDPRCFAEDAVARMQRPIFDLDFVRRFEGSRSDKQSGASAAASGSTSVVSQGPVAKVLSVAAEYGALTRTVNGQVVTIRGNPAGLTTALIKSGFVPYCVPQDSFERFCVDGSLMDRLGRFSFSASFNAAEQTAAVATADAASTAHPGAGEQVVFTASSKQLAAVSGRYEILSSRDIGSSTVVKEWAAAVAKEGTYDKLLAMLKTFANPVMLSAAYQQWQKTHAANIQTAAPNRDAIIAALQVALAELQPILEKAIPDLNNEARSALTTYSTFFARQREMLNEIANRDVLAVEAVYNRPISQPHTVNLRVIYDMPFKKTHKFVANSSVTFFKDLQVNTDGTAARVRDAQAAAQYELGLGDLAIIGPASISAAFYYQYQHAPAILTIDPLKPVPGVTFTDLPEGAKTVFAEKGDIVLGQVKLVLTPSGSSVKVPVAVSFSNRTELIDKPTWKAQLGVTYDFDSLFARGR